MLGSSVKHMEFALQARHHELVHVDVGAIKLDAADTVLHIALFPTGRARTLHVRSV